jgi:thiol-disulfide isomerase/thioredoxin
LWDVIFFGVAIYLIASRGPMWLESWQQEGTQAASGSVTTLAGEPYAFPPHGQKSVVVFWATWCGPCRVELDRLKAASEEKALDPLKVLAIDVGEEPERVKMAVTERGYPFRVLLDPHGVLATRFHVSVTPTVIFLDETGKIEWQTAGLSPTLLMRAKRYIPE